MNFQTWTLNLTHQVAALIIWKRLEHCHEDARKFLKNSSSDLAFEYIKITSLFSHFSVDPNRRSLANCITDIITVNLITRWWRQASKGYFLKTQGERPSVLNPTMMKENVLVKSTCIYLQDHIITTFYNSFLNGNTKHLQYSINAQLYRIVQTTTTIIIIK